MIPAAAAAVDVVGATLATLEWAPAPGPVAGYYVIVSRDGQPARVESVSLDTRETVGGAVGEALRVEVAAFGTDGIVGPNSPVSEPIHFVEGDGGSSAAGVHGDFDADGAADLVLSDGPSAWLWLMQGTRVVDERDLPPPPEDAELVGKGDYDGNRSADLLWQDPASGELTLWLLDRGRVIHAAPLESSLRADERWQVGGSSDFDADGDDDLLLFSRVAGQVEIWSLGASGAVVGRVRHPGRVGAWSVAAVGDVDGDAVAEVVWMDERERDLVLEAPGMGALALPRLAPSWRILATADRDGDGRAELLLHEPASGALSSRTVDAQGLTDGEPLTDAPGRFGGRGDVDADGRDDLVFSDAATGRVTLWLSTDGEPVVVEVDRPLAGGEPMPGIASSDSTFRERFCNGDLDGDGFVTAGDFQRVLVRCLYQRPESGCENADMDGDGAVTEWDVEIFLMRFAGEVCEDR